MKEKCNDTLILLMEKNSLFFNDLNNVEALYRCLPQNFFLRLLLKFNSPLIYIFYNKWKHKLSSYKTVILFDVGFNDFIPKYIKHKNKNIKIILWYWNSLEERGNKVIDNKFIDEIWTYNHFDAEKYNLKCNSQFYYRDIVKSKKINRNNNCVFDVIFLGKDKGRLDTIINLQKKLESKNLKCDFNIVKTKKDYIGYYEYLSKLMNSKCILDINFSLPCGLTLRPFEAMYFKKKLITNNTDIVNYKFYNKKNIFIIGKDDFEKIYSFINEPYDDVSEDIKEYYDYSSWLYRISNGIDVKY